MTHRRCQSGCHYCKSQLLCDCCTSVSICCNSIQAARFRLRPNYKPYYQAIGIWRSGMEKTVVREATRQPTFAEVIPGLNVLTLASQGYPSRFWLTFNQASKLGGRIRKGEHSSPVIYWNIGEEREYTTRGGEARVSKPFLLRHSSVFNLSQTEGMDLPASALQENRTNNPIEDCERIE